MGGRGPLGAAGDGTIRLGLIGDAIAASRAPALHEVGGRLAGLAVRYDRLVPRELGLGFEAVFERARAAGYRGLNVTHPYKERAVPLLSGLAPGAAGLGAVNTVVFEGARAQGHNTDRSGFVAAYRAWMSARTPGAVCVLGAGGAGRAVTFALLDLGAGALRLVDREPSRAEALARALRAAAPDVPVLATADPAEGAAGASGLVNCTPLGMAGHEGTPLPRVLMRGAAWAFDAVYTPPDTRFLRDAAAEGLRVLGGEELFVHQGLHAFALFHGRRLDERALRAALTAADRAPRPDPAAGAVMRPSLPPRERR